MDQGFAPGIIEGFGQRLRFAPKRERARKFSERSQARARCQAQVHLSSAKIRVRDVFGTDKSVR